MADHIDLPGGGKLIGKSDKEPRNTQFHKAIVKVERIPGYKARFDVTLECGHVAMAFGNLKHAKGRVLCQPCMDAAHFNN